MIGKPLPRQPPVYDRPAARAYQVWIAAQPGRLDISKQRDRKRSGSAEADPESFSEVTIPNEEVSPTP